MPAKPKHVDVLILGAGISGIGAAYYLQTMCPEKSYAILERRERIGGTWDLFRYPGIRSDSDMYTFGYAFKPWTNPKMISDGESIRDYLVDTAKEYGIDKKITYGVKAVSAAWSSDDARWTVETVNEKTGKKTAYTCDFLISGTGYYNYDEGYAPHFPGQEKFRGTLIHPQHWPEDFDYAGKRIVIIGSGATAVTLVPSLAEKAAHVTMLQRSPTYVVSLPERDRVSNALRGVLPEMLVYKMARVRNVSLQVLIYRISKAYPKQVRNFLLGQLRRQLGDAVDMKHFTPKYDPWDERLCAVPDGDMFKTLREGKASVVTDQIERFTAKGIRLKSGAELEADVIITATGLNMQMLGGMSLSVDGEAYHLADHLAYKAIMFDGLPNFAMLFGYPNASWTMKVTIACEYIGRLLNYMDKRKYAVCTPTNNDPSIQPEPFVGLQSGYVKRAEHLLPKQGSKAPWRLYNNFWLDWLTLKLTPIDDGVMAFARKPAQARKAAQPAA